MKTNLERLFNPKSIAVIGASQDLKTISGQPIAHLKNHHYKGTIYPVNPKYNEVGGYKCYPSVENLPETPDLALVLVNAARVPAILRECGEKGVPYAIIFSSGFSEIGGQGVQLQQEVIDIAEKYNIGVVGPNCQGMMNIADGVFAGFGAVFQIESFRSGPVSMVTQSGGFGTAVVSLSEREGLGFRYVINTGNEVGISTLDFVQYFLDDPHTEIITGYIEGLKDARRLLEIGESALSRRKPILFWKVGNTEVGQKAAASHTANLGGETVLYQAAFKQNGIIQVYDIQDMVDYGKAFRSGKFPQGNRVAIITISGGAGILLADQCVEMGLEVPSLTPESIEKLKKVVPSFGSLVNPIDVTANIFNQPDLLREALQIVVDDPQIDSVAVVNASVQGELAVKIAEEIVEVNKRTDKPIFVSWSARDELAKDAYQKLDEAKVPHYKTPVRCGKSLGVLSQYASAVRKYEERQKEKVIVQSNPQARAAIAGQRDDISEYEAKKILQQYGMAVTQEELAKSLEEAKTIANRIGYPVVLKVQSPDIPHKTEAKAVRLGILSEQELMQSYDEILQNAKSYNPDARIDGVLVQEMVTESIEVILGVKNDPLFGPAVMFGLGGIFAEVLKDVTFRLVPITHSVAQEMVKEIKAYPILTGARGKANADVEALTDAIVKLSSMAMDLKNEIAEMDINPLFVFPKGKGVKAGDALIKPLLATI